MHNTVNHNSIIEMKNKRRINSTTLKGQIKSVRVSQKYLNRSLKKKSGIKTAVQTVVKQDNKNKNPVNQAKTVKNQTGKGRSVSVINIGNKDNDTFKGIF